MGFSHLKRIQIIIAALAFVFVFSFCTSNTVTTTAGTPTNVDIKETEKLLSKELPAAQLNKIKSDIQKAGGVGSVIKEDEIKKLRDHLAKTKLTKAQIKRLESALAQRLKLAELKAKAKGRT